MDVTDQPEVVTHRADDVTVGDLYMIDIVNDSDVGRSGAPANVKAPVNVVENLVGSVVCFDL